MHKQLLIFVNCEILLAWLDKVAVNIDLFFGAQVTFELEHFLPMDQSRMLIPAE